jgi:hypothetical protein
MTDDEVTRPTQLPLIVEVLAAMTRNAAPTPDATITVQLNTIGGDVVLAPLSLNAAVSLLTLLTQHGPVRNALGEKLPPIRPH